MGTRFKYVIILSAGEVTEWFKVTVLKTVVGQLTRSSNLLLSAKLNISILAIDIFNLTKRFELLGFAHRAKRTMSSAERRADGKAPKVFFRPASGGAERYLLLSAK